MESETSQNTIINRKITTIKLSDNTKKRIEHLKLYPRETYEEILQRMLDIINTARQSPERAKGKLIMLERQKKRNFNLSDNKIPFQISQQGMRAGRK